MARITSRSSTSNRASSASSRANNSSVCCATGTPSGPKQRWQIKNRRPSRLIVRLGLRCASKPPTMLHSMRSLSASGGCTTRSASRGRSTASTSPAKPPPRAANFNASKRVCACFPTSRFNASFRPLWVDPQGSPPSGRAAHAQRNKRSIIAPCACSVKENCENNNFDACPRVRLTLSQGTPGAPQATIFGRSSRRRRDLLAGRVTRRC